MFRGYAGNNGGSFPDRNFNAPSDREAKIRLAVQTCANRRIITQKTQKEKEEEEMVFQQNGYGESSSDDDAGGVKLAMDNEEHHRMANDAFVLPEQRRLQQARERQQTQNFNQNRRGGSAFTSFPSVPQHSSSSRQNRKRSKSRERRRRDRSSSMESSVSRSTTYSKRSRHDSRDRSRKKKKKSRRHSTSSSSSSSSDERSRKVKKTNPKTVKYEFLRRNEGHENDLTGSWIIRHDRCDPENWTLGVPRKEISTARLGCHVILGLENNYALFTRLYGTEVESSRKGSRRSFYQQLADIENRPVEERPRMETEFLKCKVTEDGFWKLSARNILNELNDVPENEFDQHQTRQDKIKQLENHIKHARSDASALLQLIELEEEQNRANIGSSAWKSDEIIAGRHAVMLEKAMKQNQNEPKLHLKYAECRFRKDDDKTQAVSKLENVCKAFAQNPMVWKSYLDAIQYDVNLYGDMKMKQAFETCLDKAHDMLAGIMVSHEIVDMPAFRSHYLSSYIRYLKWLLACGHTPVALACIQATMEFNFALALDKKRGVRDRYEELKQFWQKNWPRIGDVQGCGAKKMSLLNWPEANVAKLEMDQYQQLCSDVENGTERILAGDDIRKNWVEFERYMADVDARVKRTPFEDSEPYMEENQDEKLEHYTFYQEIKWREKNINIESAKKEVIVFNPSIDNSEFEFVQPLLEVLGVRFKHTTGYYSNTEQVISEWISYDVFRNYTTNFDEIPTYTENTCLSTGERIIHFHMRQRFEETKEGTRYLDPQLMRYIFAFIETAFVKEEKNMLFYRLTDKKMKSFMKDITESLKEILGRDQMMNSIVALVQTDRFVAWAERMLNEQTELKRLDALREVLDAKECKVLDEHLVSAEDVMGLKNFTEKIFQVLNSINKTICNESSKKPLGDPTLSYQTLQCRLYSTVIRARLYVLPGSTERIRRDLARALMDDPDDVIQGLDLRGRLWKHVHEAIEELVLKVEQRDNHEGKNGIPEIPRASTLCKALRNCVYFVFLGRNPTARDTINKLTIDTIKTYDQFETNKKDLTRGSYKKYLDLIDTEFMTDTLITMFSKQGNQVYYCQNYTELIKAASNAFPCHVKYVKRLAEHYSNNRYQLIKLRTIIDERNKEIRKKMLDNVDPSYERCLLMNGLTMMYATKRICDRADTDMKRMLYKEYLKEAKLLHDPAIWRMVFKPAVAVSMKTLEEEANVSARAQCLYARNIYLDYVDHFVCSDEEESIIYKTLLSMLQLSTDTSDDAQTTVFMDDPDTLSSLMDCVKQRNADKQHIHGY